jgi:hypothetical protein
MVNLFNKKPWAHNNHSKESVLGAYRGTLDALESIYIYDRNTSLVYVDLQTLYLFVFLLTQFQPYHKIIYTIPWQCQEIIWEYKYKD